MATVFLSIPLRRYTDGEASTEAPGATLRALVRNLNERYPGIVESLVNPEDTDRLMPGLAAIVDGEPAHMGLLTPLDEQSEVHFIPAISGGAPVSTPERRGGERCG